MFSLENFYYILYTNLLQPARIAAYYFLPFGSTDSQNLVTAPGGSSTKDNALFWDQEPLIKKTFSKMHTFQFSSTKHFKLLANSEHSPLKKELCRSESYTDWYYFYHGFAALDWYRDYQYLPKVENQFTKVFINLNRLVTKDRSYRLLLVSKMLEQDLVKHGLVSLSLDDHGQGTWQDEINDPDSKLPRDQIGIINDRMGKLTGSLVVDYEHPRGSLSADAGPNELKLNQSALWHVVSETVFYYDKLHLTEKIFKPIVSRRPFILVGATGNLAYLKSYGFKTFDRWIDESYDAEPDPTRRIEMIVTELEKLCNLSMQGLKQMHEEMQEILDHNFNHLYTDFKSKIVDELVDNFENAIHIWNHGRFGDKTKDISQIDLAQVKRLLKS
jgi:hypothetical protein